MGRQFPINFSIPPTQSISHDQNSIFHHETTLFISSSFIAFIAITITYLTFLSICNRLLQSRNAVAGAPTNRDLSMEAMKDFKVRIYKKASEDREVETCDVCLEDFEEGEMVKVLPRCGHIYHDGCIDGWLRQSMSCPHCRKCVIDLEKSIANVSSQHIV